MDPAAFRRLIDDVRDRTDLAALVGEDTALTSVGSVLKGLSPFRAETTPSFVVWPHTQTWRDFSGGGSDGGDCFAYVQRRDGVSFVEALRTLAGPAGQTLPGADADPAVVAEIDQLHARRRVEALLTAAAAYYHHVLPSKIRETWFRQRYGFTDATTDTLLLGWADGHLFEHLTALLGATREEALATGLFVRLGDGRVEDFFRDRLVFPYWRRGRVVYFIARATEHSGPEPWEQAKYKKLLTRSERHPYVAACIANDTFYNEDVARGAEQLLITEGVTDCISAMQAGVPCLSPVTVRFREKDHARLLACTARTRRVIICNDAEQSGAGEAGALDTAAALHAAGRDVRIAQIPRPAGRDKIDLNELVVAEGAESLQRVLAAAQRYVAHLIDRVPADTAKLDLPAALAPALELLRAASPLEQDAYVELLRTRFKLRASTARALLRAPEAPPAEAAEAPAEPTEDARKGEVFEEQDHYYELDREGAPVVLSSFQIEPTARIVLDDAELIEADVTTERGTVFHGLRFPRDAWNSRRAFLAALRPVELQWTGTDENVQGVLRLVASRKVPVRRGTRNLGYLETPHGPRWVTPGSVIAPAGQDPGAEALVYVSSGATLDARVRFPVVDDAVERALAATVLPDLLRVNTAATVLPILGWFFATPLKPRIARALGHFPILVIWGTQGSGKSSLVMQVFWRLFGVTETEPYSATETEFALLKLLAATDSVPVFIDEYKPFDMPKHRRHALHRAMRRLYTGEVEERGRADQTLVTYRLAAPLCLAGETRPIEPALVERIVAVNPDKDALLLQPAFRESFTRLRAQPLGDLAAGIVRFLLARDTDADLATARTILTGVLGPREVPPRVRDNLTVMVLGLLHLEEYAAHHGVALPELDLATAVRASLDDLFEGGDAQVKTGLEYFLEELSVMAVTGALQPGRHYTFQQDLLALHFPSCHAAYAEHCRRTGFEGEVLDRKALRRQCVEAQRRGGYLREVDALVCFNGRGDRRRALLVDLEAAKQALAMDDFPHGEASSSPRTWDAAP